MIEREKRLDATIKLLSNHYLINIVILLILFILAMFKLTPFFIEKQMVNIIIERYIIVIIIIAIPGILKLFANLLKKVPQDANIEFAIRKYKNAFFIRLYTISTLTLINIILYDYSGNINFFWITTVLFIFFIYCKPSFPELEKLLKPIEDIDKSNKNDVYIENENVDTQHNKNAHLNDDDKIRQEE